LRFFGFSGRFGAIVYQATAPPPDQSQGKGFRSRTVCGARYRRDEGGNRAEKTRSKRTPRAVRPGELKRPARHSPVPAATLTHSGERHGGPRLVPPELKSPGLRAWTTIRRKKRGARPTDVHLTDQGGWRQTGAPRLRLSPGGLAGGPVEAGRVAGAMPHGPSPSSWRAARPTCGVLGEVRWKRAAAKVDHGPGRGGGQRRRAQWTPRPRNRSMRQA